VAEQAPQPVIPPYQAGQHMVEDEPLNMLLISEVLRKMGSGYKGRQRPRGIDYCIPQSVDL